MWSIAGITVVRLGVPREKKSVASLKICKAMRCVQISEERNIPVTHHKVLLLSSIPQTPVHTYEGQSPEWQSLY
jgi:hypothetical protein